MQNHLIHNEDKESIKNYRKHNQHVLPIAVLQSLKIYEAWEKLSRIENEFLNSHTPVCVATTFGQNDGMITY